MARKTPTVWVRSWGEAPRAEVELPGQSECGIRLDSAAWWAWLEAPSTLSFSYPIYDRRVGYIRGFMTVRKERRARGSHYWVAYRRIGGRLRKIYLGCAEQLTQRQLAASAARFLVMEAPAGEAQKEVMPGQRGGASFEREATPRRMARGHELVGGDDAAAGTYWPTMGGAIWPAVMVHSRATIDTRRRIKPRLPLPEAISGG